MTNFIKPLLGYAIVKFQNTRDKEKVPKTFRKKNNQGTHRGKDIIIAPEFLIAFLEASR